MSNGTNQKQVAKAHLIRTGAVNPATGRPNVDKIARTGIGVPNKPTTGNKSGGRKGK